MTVGLSYAPLTKQESICIVIGGTSTAVRTTNLEFIEMLADRYNGFVFPAGNADVELDIDIFDNLESADPDEDLKVFRDGQEWLMQRGDFFARWNPATCRGYIRQAANPYAIDSVLRIIHSLVLAGRGGFLLHAASAIRNGRAFLFMGVSGAGKTTISRLAPADAKLLTDEISYVIPDAGSYLACGTPFAGELARLGENVSAPLETVFLLEKGPENRIEAVNGQEAIRALMRNILFFAHDSALVRRVFDGACKFVNEVPVRRLIFVPDQRVWNIIG